MQDKICIVTGANAGIGKITAEALAQKGAKVVMFCRNMDKAEAARKEIIKNTNNANIDLIACDFASLAQIREAAKTFQSRYEHVDVLVNNAGFIAGAKRELSTDGYEMTFAVNHLGYFMLTNLLKKELLAAPMPRVVSVSSEAHRFATVNMDDLELKKGYSAIKSYALSKLLNIYFARELARRTKGSTLTSNCLHPGGVATNFAKGSSLFVKLVMTMARPFLITPEKGAETSIYLATSPDVANITGEYFDKKRVRSTSHDALNEYNMKKLWELSTQMCQLEGQTF
ncbi:MAG: SDR family oxidoreductase [Cytophagales bacterium]|nr:MAG: SDR family oxidoreductase [Cytophagales bacterium]